VKTLGLRSMGSNARRFLACVAGQGELDRMAQAQASHAPVELEARTSSTGPVQRHVACSKRNRICWPTAIPEHARCLSASSV